MFALMIIICVLMIGCTQNDNETEPKSTPWQGYTEINVWIGYPEIIYDSGTAVFTIKSNLPEGMLLDFLLDDYIEYSEVQRVMSNSEGTFISDMFPSEGTIKEAPYKLTITSSSWIHQSSDVKSIIGGRGQYLRGDLVFNRSNRDGVYGNYYIEKEFVIIIE